MKLERPLVVLDTEWTADNPRRARLLTLGTVRLAPDGTERERSWGFNPGCRIERGAQAVHGIDEARARTWPRFGAAAEEVEAELADCDLGGYCARGDLRVLVREFERCGRLFTISGRRILDGYALWALRSRWATRTAR